MFEAYAVPPVKNQAAATAHGGISYLRRQKAHYGIVKGSEQFADDAVWRVNALALGKLIPTVYVGDCLAANHQHKHQKRRRRMICLRWQQRMNCNKIT